MSIEEVSQSLGIQYERLTLLEQGKSTPTGDEILMFSDYYKQDYHFFITNEYKSSIEQVQILYRKHGTDFSKADRLAVQEFLYLCECEQLAYSLTKTNHINYTPSLYGSYFIGHGIETAKDLRFHLGLKTETLINDPYHLFRKLGIHIFRRKLENSSISGLFIMHPKAGKCILVNYNEDIFRQNFTVAHEVGHAIFDAGEEINVSFEKWNKGDLKEKRANYFASNFLIPQEELLKRRTVNWNKEILLKFAIQLKVNAQPLAIALKNANLIDDDKAREFSNYKIPAVDKLDPELIGLSEKRLQIKKALLEKGLSEHYLKTCYSVYENGNISAQRLSEMLLIDENRLPELLSYYNLKLSYDN